MPLSQRNLTVLLLILSLYAVEPDISVTLIKDEFLWYAQFVGLAGFTYEVYNLTVIQPVAPILEYARKSVKEWLLGGALKPEDVQKPWY